MVISNEIKDYIFQQRENNVKWKEISQQIEEKYDLSISEGNLYNIYTRAKNKSEKDHTRAEQVLNVYLRTMNKQKTCLICGCSEYYVNKVLRTQTELRLKLQRNLICKARFAVLEGLGFEQICEKLSLTDVPIDLSVAASIVMRAEEEEKRREQRKIEATT